MTEVAERSSDAERVRVYWAPGCTSCLRTKEFLVRHGIDFESINPAGNAEAVEQMRRLGARSVPVVARGDRFVYAQKLSDIAEFLGMVLREDAPLDADELVRRINIVLPAAQRYIAQIPDAVLDARFRNSVRPLRGIAHHVFGVVDAFVIAVETGVELSNELLMAETERVQPGDDVLAYGSAVIERFNAWWRACPDRSVATTMDTYFGRQRVHEVLERTAWHAAQHARQLMFALDTLGIAPDGPLAAADLAGLPLPEKVWED